MIQGSLIDGEDRTIFSFLWSVIRPYRWWYVLMLQAPIIGAFYQVVNAFLLKFIIDSFGDDAEVGNTDLLLPILFYIGALLVHELAWR
jgi:ATP-binding cassette subfamily B protein